MAVIAVLGASLLPAAADAQVGAAPSSYTWDLSTDMAAHPTSNPVPDAYGNSGVWTYESGQLASGSAPDSNEVLSNHSQTACNDGTSAVADTWLDPVGDWAPLVENIPCNSEGTVVHPGRIADAVIAWTAPVSGVFTVSGSLQDEDPNGGDGVNWYLFNGSSPLNNGSMPNGGTATIATTTGISLSVGQTIYLHVNAGPTGDTDNDTTGVDLTITGSVQPSSDEAAVSTVDVTPSSVPADGHSMAQITVDLQQTVNGQLEPLVNHIVQVGPASASPATHSTIVAGGPTDSFGRSTFTVYDATAESVLYAVKDFGTPGSNASPITINNTGFVSFISPGGTGGCTKTWYGGCIPNILNPGSLPGIESCTTGKATPSGGPTLTLLGSHLTGLVNLQFTAGGHTQTLPVTTSNAKQLTAGSKWQITNGLPAGASLAGALLTFTGGHTAMITGCGAGATALPAIAPANPGVPTGIVMMSNHKQVAVHGTGMATVTAVRFGTALSPSITHVSTSEVLAVVPPHNPADSSPYVHVEVNNPNGFSSWWSGDVFAYPHVTDIQPSGNKLLVNGVGLAGVTKVAFGLTSLAAPSGVTDTQVEVPAPGYLPAGRPDVDVRVGVQTPYGPSDNAGTACDSVTICLTLTAPPVLPTKPPTPATAPSITGWSSSTVPVLGSLHLTGKHFLSKGTQVHFVKHTAKLNLSDPKLVATCPPASCLQLSSSDGAHINDTSIYTQPPAGVSPGKYVVYVTTGSERAWKYDLTVTPNPNAVIAALAPDGTVVPSSQLYRTGGGPAATLLDGGSGKANFAALNEDIAAVITADGRVINAGSGNVIAAGSGNVINAGAYNFTVSSTAPVLAQISSDAKGNLHTAPVDPLLAGHLPSDIGPIAGVINAGAHNFSVNSAASAGAMITLNGSSVIAAGAGNVIAAGAGNVIAAGAGNLQNINAGAVIAAGAGNVIAAGAGNVIAAGSGNYGPYFASLISSAGNSGLISKGPAGFTTASLIAGLMGN